MTPEAHTPKPSTRENPPTIYPSNFVFPSTHNKWWRGKDSNLRRRKPADLQSAPVGRLGTPPGKNEPRILVTPPRGVNGIGATFATLRPLTSGLPGRPLARTLLYMYPRGCKSPNRSPGWAKPRQRKISAFFRGLLE